MATKIEEGVMDETEIDPGAPGDEISTEVGISVANLSADVQQLTTEAGGVVGGRALTWPAGATLRLIMLMRMNAEQFHLAHQTRQVTTYWDQCADVLNAEFGTVYTGPHVGRKWFNSLGQYRKCIIRRSEGEDPAWEFFDPIDELLKDKPLFNEYMPKLQPKKKGGRKRRWSEGEEDSPTSEEEEAPAKPPQPSKKRGRGPGRPPMVRDDGDREEGVQKTADDAAAGPGELAEVPGWLLALFQEFQERSAVRHDREMRQMRRLRRAERRRNKALKALVERVDAVLPGLKVDDL